MTLATDPTTPTTTRRAFAGVSPLRPGRSPMHAIVIHHADVVRAGISAVLTGSGMGDVSGAGSVFDALRIAGVHLPQVILFDYASGTGPEICRLLGGLWPRPRLIAMVGPNQPATGRECLSAGADAAVAIEGVSRDSFVECIQLVLAGNGPIMAGFPVEQAAAGDTVLDDAPTALLTRREREMLFLIGEGLSNREIASALVLSVKTIEAHRSNLSRKLNIRSRAGLMRLAMGGGAA